MDRITMEGYIDKLDELIKDEDKIVTYKYLSKTLNVGVNTAKQLLNEYMVKQCQQQPQLSATYLIAGRNRSGVKTVCIVRDEHLDAVYSELENITSKHIYSIQNLKTLKNYHMLYVADSKLEPVDSFPVKCREASALKASAKKSFYTNDEGKSNETNGVTPQLNDIKESNKKSSGNSKFGNIQSMFQKVKDVKKNEEEPGVIGMEKSSGQIVNTKQKVNTEPPKSTKSTTNKRKRIVLESDSDSDEEMANEEELIPEEPENTYEESLNSPVKDTLDDELKEETIVVKGKKRRRKEILKEVELEDGYKETTWEVVYETESDSESPQKKTEENKTPPKDARQDPKPSKIAASRKTADKKQPKIYSFFKKNN